MCGSYDSELEEEEAVVVEAEEDRGGVGQEDCPAWMENWRDISDYSEDELRLALEGEEEKGAFRHYDLQISMKL